MKTKKIGKIYDKGYDSVLNKYFVLAMFVIRKKNIFFTLVIRAKKLFTILKTVFNSDKSKAESMIL